MCFPVNVYLLFCPERICELIRPGSWLGNYMEEDNFDSYSVLDDKKVLIKSVKHCCFFHTVVHLSFCP